MLKRNVLLLCLTAFVTLTSSAQTSWPTKPIRLIVPYPPGGPVDQLARAIAPKRGEAPGQNIIIDNKAGASGTIGMDAAIKAEPDGYTFGFGVPGGITVLPHLQKLPYVVDNINYVSLVARVPQVITVGPQVPVKTLQELIALAKQQPGKINYGSAGNATTPHLGAELFAQEAGIKMAHIPYKGAAPAMNDVIGGQVGIGFKTASGVTTTLLAGKLRPIAVAGRERMPQLPDVPTLIELGFPDFEVSSWSGLLAPTGTPSNIINLLAKTTVEIMKSPDIRKQLEGIGAFPVGSTPAEFKKYIEAVLQDEKRKSVVSVTVKN